MVEPLCDDFFKHAGIKSTSSYHTYLTRSVISLLPSPSVIEKNYIDIVAFSIASGNKAIALLIIDNMLSAIPKGKAKSALSSFRSFIDSNSSKQMAQTSLQKCGVSTCPSVKTKMKTSLKNQSRISGSKTWLPLIVLRKLYKDCFKSQEFEKWIDDIYNKIRIIIFDNTGSVTKHIFVKDVDYIGICRSGDVVALYNNCWVQVMTPTGYLNTKCNMQIFGDIGDISIDHITPIDRTLRSLALPQLNKISDFVKEVKYNNPNLKGKQLENESVNIIKRSCTIKRYIIKVVKASGKSVSINLNSLKKELDSISNDSHYRLMSRNINSGKSNYLNYERFYYDTINDKYYGYIGECKMNSTTDGVIYQDLDTDHPNVIDDTSWNAYSLKPIKDVDVPIEKL